MIRTFATAAAILCLAGCTASGAPDGKNTLGEQVAITDKNASSLEDLVDQVVRQGMEDDRLPGVSVAVVRDGQILLAKGYGSARAEDDTKADEDTRFRIGSISKAVTAVALTALIDQGRVGLNDPVSMYVDGIENSADVQGELLVRHLMSHTAGFDQIGIGRQLGPLSAPFADRVKARPSLATFLKGNLRRVRPAGEMFVYDTYAIVAIGRILEKVTGKPYEEAMDELVFQPLEMSRTGIDVIGLDTDGNSTGYGWTEEAGFEPVPYESYITVPASSIDSTASDMAKLLRALTGDGNNAFSASAAKDIRDGDFRPSPDFPGAGYGFWDATIQVGEAAVPVRLHGGDMLGFHSLLLVHPESRVGIFISANRNSEAGGGGIGLHKRLASKVLGRFLDRSAMRTDGFAISGSVPNPTDYVGEYISPLYCKSCNEAELQRGAWRPSGGPVITTSGADLMLDGKYRLLPAADRRDVLIRADNNAALLFTRNSGGEVIAVSFQGDPVAYEKRAR